MTPQSNHPQQLAQLLQRMGLSAQQQQGMQPQQPQQRQGPQPTPAQLQAWQQQRQSGQLPANMPPSMMPQGGQMTPQQQQQMMAMRQAQQGGVMPMGAPPQGAMPMQAPPGMQPQQQPPQQQMPQMPMAGVPSATGAPQSQGIAALMPGMQPGGTAPGQGQLTPQQIMQMQQMQNPVG